jgi:hypothetical protein
MIKGAGSMNGHNQDSFETSYDSSSQISEADLFENNRKFFIGSDNSPTDDSQSQNQQTLLQTLLKQSNNNILSFDTIKRYFLNNPTMTTSQSANILNNFSTLSSSNNNTGTHTNDLYNSLNTNFTQNRDYNSLDDNEERVKIINEFKQKTFDEIKGDLNKTNQQNDKYKQVLEFLSKEIHTTDSQQFQQQQQSFLSILEKNPFQQQTRNQQQQQQQKQLVPLNDIEFPQLFMY